MENKILWRVIYYLVVQTLLILSVSNKLIAQGPKRESFTWYNGDSPRTVYLDLNTAFEKTKALPSATVKGGSVF